MKTFEQYKSALGAFESGNRYTVKNKLGFMGRYQFGLPRLKDLGYTGSGSEFLNSPELQEKYFLLHVADHAKSLVSYVAQAKTNIGSDVTLSGLVAGAHLGGLGGVKNLINSGIDRADANGTKISKYVKMFSGYELPGYETEPEKKK